MRWMVLYAALLCAGRASAEPTPADANTDTNIAKAHFQTGSIYYDAGRFPEAAREFEEAYRLSHLVAFLYNMGKAYDRVGDPAKALSAYRRYLTAPARQSDAAEVRGRIAALEHSVARVRIAASVSGAKIELDGASVGTSPIERLELNPGQHKLEITSEGYASWRQAIVLAADEDRTVEATLISLVKVIRVSDRTPVYKRWWPWTLLAAVVVAGGVTGGVLGARAARGAAPPEARLPDVTTP